MDSKLVVDKIDMLVTETDQGSHNQIEDTKKAPEHSQEQIKKERTSLYMGSLQPEAEGSPAPEVTEATSFERSVTRRPTVSSRYINISIKGGLKSRKTPKYRSVSESDLSKINRYGREVQDAAIVSQLYYNGFIPFCVYTTYFTLPQNIKIFMFFIDKELVF